MYRKVYGNLEDCNGYIQDKNHKAIVWKTHQFCFILENKTQYMLEVRRKNGEFLGMIFPKRKKEILCKKMVGWRDKGYRKRYSAAELSVLRRIWCYGGKKLDRERGKYTRIFGTYF